MCPPGLAGSSHSGRSVSGCRQISLGRRTERGAWKGARGLGARLDSGGAPRGGCGGTQDYKRGDTGYEMGRECCVLTDDVHGLAVQVSSLWIRCAPSRSDDQTADRRREVALVKRGLSSDRAVAGRAAGRPHAKQAALVRGWHLHDAQQLRAVLGRIHRAGGRRWRRRRRVAAGLAHAPRS